MRSKWRAAIAKEFRTLMKEQDYFQSTSDLERKSMGIIMFRRSTASETHFVSLQFSPKRSEFTFECAWSDDQDFPAYEILLSSAEVAEAKKGRIRIGDLMPAEEYDKWWWVRKESEIPEVSRQAFAALNEYLLPFIDARKNQ